jgi:MFS family permease
VADTANAPEEPEGGFISKFTVLKSAPRELWLIYYAKVMEIAAYGLVSMGLMLYLITDLGLKDFTAGTFIMVWSLSISLFTLLAGGVCDAVGIRRAFLYGFGLVLVSRLVIALFDDTLIVTIFGLAPMSIGLALMVPVMTAAMRLLTNKKQRSIGFSLYYVLMNLGFMISGKLFDVMRTSMGKDGALELGFATLSVYQTVFLVSVVFTALGMIPILFFFRKGVEMDEEEDTYTVDPSREMVMEGGIIKSFWDVAKKTLAIFKEVFGEGAFYRFLLLVGLLVGVRMVFYHMHYTLPPWSDRELGFGSRFGTAWGVLNPAIIVILVPLIGAWAQKISSYKMIVVGTFFSAGPCLLLVLPNDFFVGLVDTQFGEWLKWFLDIDGDLSPVYITLVIFVIIFSLGEAIWSPRLYEYTASIAPRGREGTYMSLSILPYFVAKFFVGPLSGFLLEHFCPAEGARVSSLLWWTVAIIAIISPICILGLKGVINPKGSEEDRSGGSGNAPTEDKGDDE